MLPSVTCKAQKIIDNPYLFVIKSVFGIIPYPSSQPIPVNYEILIVCVRNHSVGNIQPGFFHDGKFLVCQITLFCLPCYGIKVRCYGRCLLEQAFQICHLAI